MSNYSIAPMRPGEGTLTYALVRTLAPEIGPDIWADFVGQTLECGGIFMLHGPDGGIFGLASYRPEGGAHSGGSLLVEAFLTIEVGRAAKGRELLLRAIDEVAAELGCREVIQLIGCAPGGRSRADWMRNHVSLSSASGLAFNRGKDCSCGSLPPLSAAEMYPAP